MQAVSGVSNTEKRVWSAFSVICLKVKSCITKQNMSTLTLSNQPL